MGIPEIDYNFEHESKSISKEHNYLSYISPILESYGQLDIIIFSTSIA